MMYTVVGRAVHNCKRCRWYKECVRLELRQQGHIPLRLPGRVYAIRPRSSIVEAVHTELTDD
jgi:hypothetical protein